MNWLESYTASWRVFRVNRRTWADAESVPNVISVDAIRTADGNIIESGSMKVTGDIDPDYYRIVMVAEQNGEVERVDVATLLFDRTGGEYNYAVNTQDFEGFSVLYPASVTAVTAGEYAPKGANGARYAASLLESAINAPVHVEGGFILNDHVVHDLGSMIIDAVWSVLDAGGYVIQIDGRGEVYIRPKPTDPAMVIDSSRSGMLESGVSYTSDMSEVPNRYVIVTGVNVTIAENVDPESLVSTVTRGYKVDTVDKSPKTINGETPGQYANRRLKELSILREEREYRREFAPNVYPYSLIRATINGLEGDLRVQSQSISCRNGIQVSERVVKEIVLYE